jgi:hypothetical protein
MRSRPFGVIALAFTMVMIALHAQMGAIALVLTGSVFASVGSMEGAATLVLGAGYLGLTLAAYAAAYAIWMRRSWAWPSAVVVLAALPVASLLLAFLSGTIIGAPLPILASATGFWLLTRPVVKAELLGPEDLLGATVAGEGMEVAGPAH